MFVGADVAEKDIAHNAWVRHDDGGCTDVQVRGDEIPCTGHR